MRKLDLSDNPIGDKGLQYIIEALTTNTTCTLTELRLRACGLRITEENGPALTVHVMLQRNKTLQVLDLLNGATSDI